MVKTGVHYGIDYAVYRTLPTLCHSEVCALVINATNSIDTSEGFREKKFNDMNYLSGVEGVVGVGGVNGENVRGSNVGNEVGKERRIEEEAGREGEIQIEKEVEKEAEEEVEEEPLPCQQGWRHISTLTRVMPVSAHTHTRACTHTHTRTYTHVHTHTYIHTYIQSYAVCFDNLSNLNSFLNPYFNL